MLSHKRRGLLSGANKGGSTTQDANRWFNGKVCHAETNVRLVRQFLGGWILEWGAPAAGSSPRRSGRLRDPRRVPAGASCSAFLQCGQPCVVRETVVIENTDHNLSIDGRRPSHIRHQCLG